MDTGLKQTARITTLNGRQWTTPINGNEEEVRAYFMQCGGLLSDKDEKEDWVIKVEWFGEGAEIPPPEPIKHQRSAQVYHALRVAAERMGWNNYKSQLMEHTKAGRSRNTFRYNPTPEHRMLIEAMGDLNKSDDECMALLHEYDFMKQRLGC